ncbi:hypothetical protein ABRZ24_10140 [Brenneria populi]|uniref:Uncharacterized protein n=1 Tax=Brenneria populi TaxID=1505588 RepID=A0ABU6JRC1_9GAMM|nr:hypothetical protein [Brenneria populi Li et al. 2015]
MDVHRAKYKQRLTIAGHPERRAENVSPRGPTVDAWKIPGRRRFPPDNDGACRSIVGHKMRGTN